MSIISICTENKIG